MSPKNTNEVILVVDDDQVIRWTLSEALQSWGFATVEAGLAAEAVKQFQTELPAGVLLDIDLPDGSGLDVLREIKRENPEAIVIMITGNVKVDSTISALRGGAYDFIGKPINLEELRVTLRNAIETRQLRREVAQVRKERAREFNFSQIVGESPAMKKMLGLAAKVAESEVSSVLLQGESGTGKDLVAKAIHYGSQRAEGPFVAVNCAALPATRRRARKDFSSRLKAERFCSMRLASSNSRYKRSCCASWRKAPSVVLVVSKTSRSTCVCLLHPIAI
jgi:two-component system response regulator AtoC